MSAPPPAPHQVSTVPRPRPSPSASAVITPVRAGRPVVHDDTERANRPWWRRRLWLGLLVAAAVTFALHVLTNLVTPYRPHRDELLYIAMGRHLQFWRMDFPPLIALVSELERALLGDSLVAIRMVSAVASAAIVALSFGLARLFGGHFRACVLAAVATLASPLFLRAGALFQPVVLDQLWWTLGFAALLWICALAALPRRRSFAANAHGREPLRLPPEGKAWLALGVACGFGLLTKFSIVFFGAAVLVGALATPLRRALRTPWPWAALAVALLLGSPSLVGQLQLGWPVTWQMADLRTSQLERVGPIEFALGQLLLGPAIALAGYGLWFLLRDAETRHWRAIGWTCVAAFALLLVLRGKPYYLGPIYPTLFAAGAAAFERRLQRLPLRRTRTTAYAAAIATLALFGLVTLPFGLPILPPAAMARYAAALGGLGTTTNTGGRLALPQDYADMLGWPEQVAAVNAVVKSLPEPQRRDVVLVAGNYGQAGALDFYGPRVGLPPVVSAAGSFWYFGPGSLPGATIVTLGVPIDELRRYCAIVREAARVRHDNTRWVVDEERDVPIAVCEEPRQTLQDLWPELEPR